MLRDISRGRLAVRFHPNVLMSRTYLPKFVDIFTGWVEAFHTQSEKVKHTCKSPIKEIIPLSGLPKSLESSNGLSFTAKITQGLTTALGVDYKLHTSWFSQSSGKAEKMNHTLKKTTLKLCQKNSWTPDQFASYCTPQGPYNPQVWSEI